MLLEAVNRMAEHGEKNDVDIGHPVEAIPRLALDARELGLALGVSARTVRTWRESGALPAPVLKRGAVIRWSADEIRRWMAAGCPDLEAWEKRNAQ